MTDLEVVLDTLRSTRFTWTTEDDLQVALDAALRARGLDVERERRIDAHNRIDLAVGRVGIEVKVTGPWANVLRQVMRYGRSAAFDHVVLVTCRPAHARHMPEKVANTEVHVHLVGSTL